MLKDKTLTYVSLFSSAGVGCYGFHMEGYHCIATNELIEKRLQVQRVNNKCQFETGYISGDISTDITKNKIYGEISRWKYLGNDRADVVVATPPCQGISVINHKKNGNDIIAIAWLLNLLRLSNKFTPDFLFSKMLWHFRKHFA